MRVNITLVFSFLIYVSSFSQIINSSFIAPDTVCINQTFTIQNTSTGSINSTYWNFCTSSVALTASINLGASATSFPVFMSINEDAGTYYGFVSNNSPGSISRFNFGNSLNNTPTSTNLGTFGGQMPGNGEGIVIEKEGSNWYGVMVGGPAGVIVKMNFGTSLANTPTVVNMGNIGALSYPHRLKVIHSGGNKYGFTVNRNSSTITRFDFGNSLSNTPIGTNLGNLGGMSGPNDFDIVYVNGNWHMFVTNDGNNTLVRLDFGNSLLNTPIGTNLGTIGVSPLRGISIDISCGGISGQVTSQFNNFYNLNFPTGPTGIPTTAFVGNTGFSFPHSIEKYRVGNQVIAFVPNPNGNSLTRLTYTSCSVSAIANSTLTNLPPISFSVAGIYTISILNNSNQFNQSVYCKTIAVMGSTLNATASPSIGCSDTGFSSTLSVIGAGSYTWEPGSIVGNSIVVSPTLTTTYSVSTSPTIGCNNTQILLVTVVPTPTVNVNASNTVICSGKTTTLIASGASAYTWSPGSFTNATVALSPTATTIYTITGANGICVSTNTIEIDVNQTPTIAVSPSVALVCLNSSITLTGSGATNYTWSPASGLSSTNTAITQSSPTVTTTYTLVGSQNTCTNLSMVQVSVIGLPVVSIAGIVVLCSNSYPSSTTLTGNGAATYVWTIPPGFTASPSLTSNPVVVTPPVVTSAMVATMTVLGTAGTCTNDAVLTITVYPSPTITANSSTTQICSGNTITLSSNGANTYTWSPGNVVGGTVVVMPSSTTVFTVTGGNGLWCTDTAMVSVSVTATPTLSIVPSSPSVCSGNSVSLTASGALTYTWLPGSISGSIIVDNPITVAQYTLYGTNGSCSNAATATLMVVQNPTLNISASQSIICLGQSSTLSVGGANSYSWSPGTFLSTSTGSSVITTPLANICYTATGYNSFGCFSEVSVCLSTTLTSQTFTIAATPTVVCSGYSSTLQALGALNYTFYTPFVQTSSIVVSPTVATIYSVQAQFSNGCITTQTTFLNAQQSPTVSILTIPNVICNGNQASLEGSGATSYTWIPSSSNNTNIIVTPTATTTYTLFGQTGPCLDTMTTLITVNPTPTLSALVITPTLCLGKSTNMFVSGASSFTWEPGSIFGFSLAASPTVNTTYTVTGSSLNCFNTQTVDVLVFQNPTINVNAFPSLVCYDPSQTSTIIANGAISYTWNAPSSNSQSISVTPSVTSMYTVSGTNPNGCVSSNTIALNISPDLQSSISATRICSGTTVTLTASGALLYNWMPGNFSQPDVSTVPDENTTYTVTGTSGSCSKSNTVSIEVVKNPINEIPEVFTPNDDGKNDRFVIKTETLSKIDIKVFNRWGALVYSNAEYDNSWNGTPNAGMVIGGNKLPQGTYYYVIDIESCDNQLVHGYVVIQY